MRSILEGCEAVLGATPLDAGAPVVAAGIGAGEIRALAAHLGRSSLEFGTLANAEQPCRQGATHCAPAVAVARLLEAAA
jgi:hypothetical protein